MNKVFLSIGSNIGERLNNLKKATDQITLKIGELVKISSYYETEPWGFESQNYFLNQVILLTTMEQPTDILKSISEIESELGRIRKYPSFESRIIDIDILFYNDLIIDKNELKIPHPRLHQRNFILVPLTEIADDFIHPVYKQKISALAATCKDNKRVSLFSKFPSITTNN
jgi:2-amino-4-hydroxy-6-hydroxymethyldihydropteridine diphosphokinase